MRSIAAGIMLNKPAVKSNPNKWRGMYEAGCIAMEREMIEGKIKRRRNIKGERKGGKN